MRARSPADLRSFGASGAGQASERDLDEDTERSLGDRPAVDDDPRVRAAVRASLFGKPAEALTVGRYSILKVIGEGAMGTVYACFDDQLDRRVALKLIKGGQSDAARRRMMREAQAMAQLSHPNVVPVFEVGEHDGQLFVAMEYVKGVTLARWQVEEDDRPWREMVRMYVEAGRGLAAAHAAGLVHRDFKPHNAVVGNDGRVRVLDFGLAARHGDLSPPLDESAVGPAVAERALDTPLTETGTVMGTPAYMPPEQFMGGKVDARSDQFSFCVAFWEGLYGKRPFSGGSPTELFSAVVRGEVGDISRSEVPVGVRNALLRGLSTEPDDRWPELPALLEEIERHTSRGRRRWVLAATLGLLAVSVLGSVLLRDDTRTEQAQKEAAAARVEADQAHEREVEAERARARADTNMRNTLRVARAALLDHAPTEAAALLREVEGALPSAIEAWPEAVARSRDRPRRLRALFEGHEGPVNTVAFSPDGTKIVTASVDGSARVFSLDRSVRDQVFDAHRGRVWSAQFSPDGTRVATASFDGTARVFTLDGSEEPIVLEPHEATVFSATFSPDGKYIATASEDHTARVHRIDGRESAVVLEGHALRVRTARFSPDGSRVVTSSSDGDARVFDARTGESLAVLVGHEARVVWAEYSPDGSRIVTAGYDNTVRIWSAAGVEQFVMVSHTAPVVMAVFSPDGRTVLTASDDGTVRRFAADGTTASEVVARHADKVRSVSFSPDGRAFVSAAGDNVARVVALDGSSNRELTGHTAWVKGAVFLPDGRTVATVSNDQTVRLHEVEHDKTTTMLEVPRGSVWKADFSPDGALVVTAGGDRHVRLFAIDGSVEPRVLTVHDDQVGAARFSPDGRTVVTASSDGSVRVVSLDGEVVAAVRHPEPVYDAAFSPDGTRIVTGSRDRTARVWAVDGGRELAVLEGHRLRVRTAVFSPDGNRVVTASSDGVARVFDLERRSDPVQLDDHGGGVYAAAFSPDGSRVATASFDNRARVFAADGSGAPVVLVGHTSAVNSVTFSADGTKVLTSSLDGTARIFSADGAGASVVISGHSGEVYDAVFGHGDALVATAGADRSVRIVPTAPLLADSRTLLWQTPFCHLPRSRSRLLGESAEQAVARYDRCRALTQVCSTQSYAECHERVQVAFAAAE